MKHTCSQNACMDEQNNKTASREGTGKNEQILDAASNLGSDDIRSRVEKRGHSVVRSKERKGRGAVTGGLCHSTQVKLAA